MTYGCIYGCVMNMKYSSDSGIECGYEARFDRNIIDYYHRCET